MKFKKTLLRFGLIMTTLTLLIVACQKNNTPIANSSQARNVAVYLTDDPCRYDSVFIDIRYVELKIDTNSLHMNDDHWGDNDDDHRCDHQHFDQDGFWDTLSIRSGVYDILSLRNGIDTILGTANIPAGKIRKIRLTLGTDNSVVISGTSYPLNLFPGINNYVYVKIHDADEDDHFRSGQTSMWLDFNACRSILWRNGQYYLTPFLTIFALHNTGGIEGTVLPGTAQPFVTAWSSTDTASALPGHNGEYKIRGLSAGTYSVQFQGSFGYNDTTINNVEVQNNGEVHLPAITLHQ
ncbi:MAG: DUF4382 domain-containing protein [Ginsengibacter sp.]